MCARACRQLQHNIQDLSRQVTALVSQVQDLRGGRPPRQGSAAPAQPSSALVTSDDVISGRLVSFTDIQVLAVLCALILGVCAALPSWPLLDIPE